MHQRKHGSTNRAAKDEMRGLPLSTWYVPSVQTWHGPLCGTGDGTAQPCRRGTYSWYVLYSIPRAKVDGQSHCCCKRRLVVWTALSTVPCYVACLGTSTEVPNNVTGARTEPDHSGVRRYPRVRRARDTLPRHRVVPPRASARCSGILTIIILPD